MNDFKIPLSVEKYRITTDLKVEIHTVTSIAVRLIE